MGLFRPGVLGLHPSSASVSGTLALTPTSSTGISTSIPGVSHSLHVSRNTPATTTKPVAKGSTLKKRFDRLLPKSGAYYERIRLIDRNGKSLKGPVFFDNFDRFADEIAHGMRHLTKYRSDDGKYARGQARGDGTLRKIHRAYRVAAKNGAYPVHGEQCGLEVFFIRRRNADPSDRWLMAVNYRAPDLKFFNFDVPTPVQPDDNEPDLREDRCLNFRQGLAVAHRNLHKVTQPVNRKDTANLILFLQAKPSCMLATRSWHFQGALWERFTDKWDLISPRSRDALVSGKGWPMKGSVNGKNWRTHFAKPWFTEWGSFDGRWDSEAAAHKVTNDLQTVAWVMRHHVDRHRHAESWLKLVKKFDNLPHTDIADAVGKNLIPVLNLFEKMRKGNQYAYSAF